MRERLRIGEVAKLVGVTPKTVRHYEKIGLLREPERSGSGYRLYTADDLLRLRRVKRLRALGLPLKQVRSVLLGGGDGAILRPVLEALLAEVNGRIGRLEERRDDDLEADEASPTFGKVVDLLGGRLPGVSAAALEQEERVWAALDAFDWPGGYEEENEALFGHYAERSEEHRALILLGERLSDLEEAPEDDPRVGALARDLRRHFERFPPPQEQTQGSAWASEGPVGEAMFGVLMSGFFPAQRRVMALIGDQAVREGRVLDA